MIEIYEYMKNGESTGFIREARDRWDVFDQIHQEVDTETFHYICSDDPDNTINTVAELVIYKNKEQ